MASRWQSFIRWTPLSEIASTAPSSSGQGYGPLEPGTAVRICLGLPNQLKMGTDPVKYGLIVSLADPVGRGCLNLLLETGSFREIEAGSLYESPEYELLAVAKSQLEVSEEDIACLKRSRELVFLSKHSSESGKSVFTVHTTGNWGKLSEFGGDSEQLSKCNPRTLKNLLFGLKEQKTGEISLEVTHHGPTGLSLPVAFIEIGSDNIAWNDVKNQKMLINALNFLKCDSNSLCAIGFGGGHYAPEFNKLVFKKSVAIGHIGPKYADFTEKTIIQAYKNTLGCKLVYIDKKGLRKEQRDLVIRTCEKEGFPFELI